MFPLYDDNTTSHTPYVTYGLIAINVLVMVWLSTLSPLDEQIALIRHGFIPQRIAQLRQGNIVLQVSIDPQGEPQDPRFVKQAPVQAIQLEPAPGQILSTILTTLFLHSGWFHLAGNMWFLWIFGNNVEDRLGSFLFLPFYLVGGLLATACHWAYDPQSTMPVVGASGAVATILGAYGVTFPKSNVRTLIFVFFFITIVNIPALLWLGLWFAGELFMAFFSGKDLTVAVWAHIGGFLAGVLLMPILSFGAPPPGSSWEEEIKKHFSFTPADRG